MAKEAGEVEETGYSRVVTQLTERKRYRGYVKRDDDKSLMQTSTSYVREEDAIIAMHDAFEIMKRDPLINLDLDQEGLKEEEEDSKRDLGFWGQFSKRYNGG